MYNEWTYVPLGRKKWAADIPSIPSPTDYWISRWFNNFDGKTITHGIQVTAAKVKAKPDFFKTPEDAHRYAFGVMKSHHAEQERLRDELTRIEYLKNSAKIDGIQAAITEAIDGAITI